MDPDDPADADAAALAVEAILEAARLPPTGAPAPRLGKALYFCVCCDAGTIAPNWLVTDGDVPGTVSWQRVPDGEDLADLVPPGTPATVAHVDAVSVLWRLEHEVRRPFVFDDEDASVIGRLRALCTRAGAVLPTEN